MKYIRVLIEKIICGEISNDFGSTTITNRCLETRPGYSPSIKHLPNITQRFYGSNLIDPRYGKHLWTIKIDKMVDGEKFLLGIETKQKYDKNYSNFFGFEFRSDLPPIIKIPQRINTKVVQNFAWNFHSGFIQQGDIIEIELYLFEISISVLTSSTRIDNTSIWKHCNLKLTEYDHDCRLSIQFDHCCGPREAINKTILSLKEYSVNWM